MSRFLAWFEGFAENIEKQPSVKQWARIREEIGKLHETTAAPVVLAEGGKAEKAAVVLSVAAEPAPLAIPQTQKEWFDGYIAAMERLGWDAESALEMRGSGSDGVSFDPTEDPKAAAQRMHARWGVSS